MQKKVLVRLFQRKQSYHLISLRINLQVSAETAQKVPYVSYHKLFLLDVSGKLLCLYLDRSAAFVTF